MKGVTPSLCEYVAGLTLANGDHDGEPFGI